MGSNVKKTSKIRQISMKDAKNFRLEARELLAKLRFSKIRLSGSRFELLTCGYSRYDFEFGVLQKFPVKVILKIHTLSGTFLTGCLINFVHPLNTLDASTRLSLDAVLYENRIHMKLKHLLKLLFFFLYI